MENGVMLWVLVALFTKHFIVDFLMQGPYQYLNKGTYGHPGGILHAGNHAVGTWIALCWVPGIALTTLLLIATFDFVLHYHIDFAKVAINRRCGWKADTSEKFWWLLGLDQFLHSLTYIIIVAVIV